MNGSSDNSSAEPPPKRGRSIALRFDADTLGQVRRQVASFVAPNARLRVDDFVLAVNEVMTNSVLHGGGGGSLQVWLGPASLNAEVRDGGRIDDPLAGLTPPSVTQQGGRGLWILHQVCDTVEVRPLPDGQTIRFSVRE